MKNISIVIPAYIRQQQLFQMTHSCLVGVEQSHGINNCEIILVDDGSDKKWIDLLKKLHPLVNFIHSDRNYGFAKAVNAGIRNSKNEWIVLLNNDIQILQNDWLVRLINAAELYNYDIVSPKQSILDETYNYILDIDRHKYREDKCFSYPVGWCLGVKKKVFETAGILPEDFGIGFWEDTAWSYVVKNKYPQFKIGIIDGIDKIKLLHKEHQTFKTENIDLLEQYNKNRKMFLEMMLGKKEMILPKLGE
jgi:GT2 family glycosyltransferase